MKGKLKTIVILFGMSLFFLGSLLLLLSSVFEFPDVFGIISFGMVILSFICSTFGFFYCIVHATTNKRFSNELKILHAVLLVIFRQYYIPIYYCFNVIKKKKPVGILISISYFFGFFLLLASIFMGVDTNNINLNRQKKVVTNDNMVTVTLDNDYVCDDIIGYNGIECSNMSNKLTICNYSNNENEETLFQVHYEDIIRSLNDSGIDVNVIAEESNYVVLQCDESERKIVVELKILNDNLFSIVEFDTRSGEDYYYFNKISKTIISNISDNFM